MALVKCPECGKQNVSDTAESCPNCGYGIKAHYEKIQAAKLEKEEQKRRMRSVCMPFEPTFDKGPILVLAIAMVIDFFLIVSIPEGAGLFLVFEIILGIGIAVIYFQHLRAMEEYERKYALYKANPDEYRRRELHMEDIRKANEAAKPKCPHCGSSDIIRINTADRAISIGVMGLASGEIGKQYRCRKCKHMW